MPIKFKTVPKRNPSNPSAPVTYHAKAISDGEVNFDELTTILATKSRMHKADCVKLMLVLEETMQEQLQNGKIVRLGDIGNFQVGITSKGAETATKVTAAAISTAKVNFRVGKKINEMLKKLEYKKVKDSN